MSLLTSSTSDLSSSISIFADVFVYAFGFIGIILFIYGMFSIFRAVSNNQPVPFHLIIAGIFLTTAPNIFETIISGENSSSVYVSDSATQQSVSQQNTKPIAPKESEPLLTPEQWASVFKWIGYIVLSIAILVALYYSLLLSLFYYNYRASKKYIGLDNSFITITEYLDKIEVAISKNQKMDESLPKFLTNKTNHINNLLRDKRAEYKKILSSFKETLEV